MSKSANDRQKLGIGPLVARARQARGWTQRDLGERLGVDKSYVSLIETNSRRWPEEYVEALSEILGIGQVEMAVEARLIQAPAVKAEGDDPLVDLERQDPLAAHVAGVAMALGPDLRERLADYASDLLARHKARRAARRLALGPRWRGAKERAGDPVFDAGDGQPLKSWAVRGAWARVRRGQGLPAGCRLHDLRHGWVTALARGDVPLALITRLAGHASAAVTLNTYTHLGLADQASAVGALGAIFGADVTGSGDAVTSEGQETA